jgi:transposase
LWRLRTGAPWRDVPEACGNWNSLYRRFRRWSACGERAAAALAETMAERGLTPGEAADGTSYDTLINRAERQPHARLADKILRHRRHPRRLERTWDQTGNTA